MLTVNKNTSTKGVIVFFSIKYMSLMNLAAKCLERVPASFKDPKKD